MKKSTMKWADVLAIWDIPIEGKAEKKATQKGFVHKHNPARKPSRGNISPKQWHKNNRKNKTK